MKRIRTLFTLVISLLLVLGVKADRQPPVGPVVEVPPAVFEPELPTILQRIKRYW